MPKPSNFTAGPFPRYTGTYEEAEIFNPAFYFTRPDYAPEDKDSIPEYYWHGRVFSRDAGSPLSAKVDKAKWEKPTPWSWTGLTAFHYKHAWHWIHHIDPDTHELTLTLMDDTEERYNSADEYVKLEESMLAAGTEKELLLAEHIEDMRAAIQVARSALAVSLPAEKLSEFDTHLARIPEAPFEDAGLIGECKWLSHQLHRAYLRGLGPGVYDNRNRLKQARSASNAIVPLYYTPGTGVLGVQSATWNDPAGRLALDKTASETNLHVRRRTVKKAITVLATWAADDRDDKWDKKNQLVKKDKKALIQAVKLADASRVALADPPFVIEAIEDVTLTSRTEKRSVDLTGVFKDAHGRKLKVAVTSSDDLLLRISYNELTIDFQGLAAGTAILTVTATNPSGGSVKVAFDVTVP